tara:strand:+ start:96 stop:416 length:321 start_codon:yes stop_codon:yes gene_type:complete
MAEITQAIGMIAPLYNVALVIITFFLLWRLLNVRKKDRKVYLEPWKYVFAAIGLFLAESLVTALKFFGVITEQMVPRWFNAVFELVIIVLIIYMLFLQLNHVMNKK